MNSSNIVITLVLVAVILLSGCTGGEDDTSYAVGKGLSIVSFAAQGRVDSGEEFIVDLVVENTGGNEATNIKADLFQKSDFQILDEKVKTIPDLGVADPKYGIPGGDFVVSWILQAPPVYTSQLRTLKARVTYDYASTATSNLYLVPKAEYDARGPDDFPTYSTSSFAPVAIEILPMPPFRAKESEAQVPVKISLSLANTGYGYVSDDEIRNFKVILKKGAEIQDITDSCIGAEENIVKLFGLDQDTSIKCEPKIDFEGASTSHIVEVSGEYTYYTDTNPLTITVRT